MSRKRNDTSKLDALLASVTEDILGDDIADQFQEHGLRVERILLELVRPDPIQPRRVLPERIHHSFHDGCLTPTQALRELVQSAQLAARQRGQPFDGLLDLLPNPDSDTDDVSRPSPVETLLCDLVNLAVTIRDDGQVNPLTVVDVSQGVTRLYRIETGERRYWATWLLRDFIPHYQGDSMIDCIVVPAEASSAFRQAKENTARKGLNAIAMARQAALLLLTVHGYEILVHAVTNDFYRQALDLDLRGKREYTEAVLSSMGGIGRRQLGRYKSLLRLCDEAMQMADQHNLDEAHQKHIVSLDDLDQVEILQQVIQFNLTRKQIKDLIEAGETLSTDEERLVSKQIMQLAKILKSKELPDPRILAQYLFDQDENANMARARLQTLRNLIDEAEKYLSEK